MHPSRETTLHDSTQSSRTARNSLLIMVCTLLSRLLGIVKARVIGSVFGATSVADVINFTFNIPNNFRKLFAEGTVNAALIPAFSSLLGRNEKQRSFHLFALLCTFQSILLIPLVVVSYCYGEPLIAFLSDFDADQIRLGGQLLPFFMVYLATISLASIFNGVLQAHQNFLHAYLSPLFFSLCVIFGVWFLSERFQAMSMAYSVLAGGLLQGSYSYLMVRRYGYRFKPTLRTRNAPFKEVFGAWALVSLGMGMQIVTQMVSFLFASHLSEGSVTAFSNSTIFYQTPYGIFFNAIAAVSLPLMSRASAAHDVPALRTYTRNALLSLLALLLPSSILLFFLSRESVSVVLQTGNYTLEDAHLTALVLRPYLIFMVFSAWYALLLRLGYSANRHALMTRIVFLQNLLDIVLMWIFLKLGLDIVSLPLANGISYTIGVCVLLFLLRDLYPLTKDAQLFKGLFTIILANVPILAFCVFYHNLGLTWHERGSNLANLAYLVLIGVAALCILLLSYKAARIPLFSLLRTKKKGGDLQGDNLINLD